MSLCQNPKIFLWIALSVANVAAVNSNSIKRLLANGLSTFSLKTMQFLVMVLNVYLEILLIILLFAIDFFDNFILAHEPFGKTLQSLKTYETYCIS